MSALKITLILWPLAMLVAIVLILGVAVIYREEGTISPRILYHKYRDYRLYRHRLCLELKKKK